MLYSRDFNILTIEEQSQFKKAKDYASKHADNFTLDKFEHYCKIMPEAGHHFESLFPNNYLNIGELNDHVRLDMAKIGLKQLLKINVTERDILNYINENSYYFIIGSILKSCYDFGHHEAYAFREFPLPPNFVVDYLLIGKNSHGYHFVFVELENPFGSITNSDGTFGTSIRKGLKQIEEWDEWIDGNFSHLRFVFQKHLSSLAKLTNEFAILDKTRIHYTVIAGRRKDFKEKTYRGKRKLKKENNVTLLHYNNLVDNIDILRSSGNY